MSIRTATLLVVGNFCHGVRWKGKKADRGLLVRAFPPIQNATFTAT